MHDYKNHTELLNKVTDVLVIDLATYTHLLSTFADEMTPLADGFYNSLNNQLMFRPSVTNYYSVDKHNVKKQLTSLQDFQTCNTTIVSEDNALVQKATQTSLFMRKRLTDTPSTDNRYLDIIRKTIDDYLNTLCPHVKSTANSYNLFNVLRPDIDSSERRILLHNLPIDLMPVIDVISEFVGTDTWHFYFTKQKGTALEISKTIDYRIYDWYCIKFKEQEMDTTTDAYIDVCNIFTSR
jgi:hypothetical protein